MLRPWVEVRERYCGMMSSVIQARLRGSDKIAILN
jgi:hypothetical protein